MCRYRLAGAGSFISTSTSTYYAAAKRISGPSGQPVSCDPPMIVCGKLTKCSVRDTTIPSSAMPEWNIRSLADATLHQSLALSSRSLMRRIAWAAVARTLLAPAPHTSTMPSPTASRKMAPRPSSEGVTSEHRATHSPIRAPQTPTLLQRGWQLFPARLSLAPALQHLPLLPLRRRRALLRL